MSDLDRFVAESNVRHYKRLLEQEIAPEKRKIILELLMVAEIALREINDSPPFIGKFGNKV